MDDNDNMTDTPPSAAVIKDEVVDDDDDVDTDNKTDSENIISSSTDQAGNGGVPEIVTTDDDDDDGDDDDDDDDDDEKINDTHVDKSRNGDNSDEVVPRTDEDKNITDITTNNIGTQNDQPNSNSKKIDDDDDGSKIIKKEEDSAFPPEECCPVCLHHPSERNIASASDTTVQDYLVCGPCGHALCVECMERLLNVDAKIEEQWPPQSAGDVHLSAPTLGRCPICRTVLSLFDIRKASSSTNTTESEPTSAAIYPKDEDCWNLQQQQPSSSTTTSSHPLMGSVYVPYRGKTGQLSFHWDWTKLKRFSEEPETIQRPFLNLTESIQTRPDHWKLEDGRLASRIAFFEDECHFHQRSRTFHGTIRWPKRLNGSYEWDVILGFSKDYRFLSSGRIHMKRERNLVGFKTTTQNDEKDRLVLQRRLQAMKTEQRELCKYPLDGRWTVSWIDNLGHPHRTELHVIASEYRQSGWAFYISFDDPRHPVIQWPRSKHRQWVEEGINLIQYPMGPPPGQRIRWKTTDPRFPELWWTRQTAGPVPLPRVILFGMGQDKQLYQRLNAKTDRSIPQYCGRSVFGNVFTKRLYIGSSSYHFLSPTNSFISYRHPACRDLPTLDDGSPLPTRVDFHNVVWDPVERKLTGTIEWEKDFGTSWNDNVRWTMTMYFDTEYMVILKGGIQCEWCKERRARPRPARPPPRHRPAPVPIYVPPPTDDDDNEEEEKSEEAPSTQRNEEWVMSGYGYDQVYINAAAIERYRCNKEEKKKEDHNDASTEDEAHDQSNNTQKSESATSDKKQDEDFTEEMMASTGAVGEQQEKDDGDDDSSTKNISSTDQDGTSEANGDNEGGTQETEGDTTTTVDYGAIATEHAKRLKCEGATERSISFLMYVFNTVAENEDVNPIDFLVN